MEKELKLILQLGLAVAAVWLLARAFRGKAAMKAHHRKDPSQFSQASRVWFPALVDMPRCEAYSVQPQSALYAQ